MLASEAITQAYRETAITALGEIPSPEMMAEGLSRLNGFIASLFGGDVGRIVHDWPLPYALPGEQTSPNTALVLGANPSLYQPRQEVLSDFNNDVYPPANSRVLWRGSAPETVWFDRMPQDGARMSILNVGASAVLTLNGNGRMIAGASTVVYDNTPKDYLYRAELGQWIELKPLVLTDPLPLADEFDDLMITAIAIRLAPLDEINSHSGTMFIYNRLLRRCQQRYNQQANRPVGGYRIPRTRQAF